MFETITVSKNTKYDVLTKWLKTKLENNESIKTEDLELLLLSLGIEIKHKCMEMQKNERKIH